MSESNFDNSSSSRRRAPRLRLKTPVSVSWVGGNGERQDASGTTQNVNAYGALVMVGKRPPDGCELRLTNLITKITATAKLIWTGTTASEDVYTLGLELATPHPTFWPES